MKNFIKYLPLAAGLALFSASFTSCNNDDDVSDLQDRMDVVEEKIADLEALTRELRENINAGMLITDVSAISGGWKVSFSDNSTIEIKNGATPYVYIDDQGYWSINYNGAKPNPANTAERILDENGKPIFAGTSSEDNHYVSVSYDKESSGVVITAYNNADHSVAKVINKEEGEGCMISGIIETDDFIQFNIYDAETEATTGYRFGKAVPTPTSVKIYNTVFDDVTPGMTGELVMSVSPANAIVNTENVFFDAIGIGMVSRATPVFDDMDFFEITNVVKASEYYANDDAQQRTYNDGDYVVVFNFNEAIVDHGGVDWFGGFVNGYKFDACVTFNAHPSSLTKIVGGSSSNEEVAEISYSRSVNSFTFLE